LFLLALIGFGVKAGLVPLHVWMPESYSCAPPHVAVILSGAMLNLGLYGIMRVLTLLGLGELWWAYALMGAGAFSGIFGILLALVQPGMKRTLAYSSSENVGIICLALGGAMLAMHYRAPVAAVLLLAGVFLHIWNHAAFKSLLFLGAGAVEERTRTDSIHLLGGLQKRLPFTGSCMALGSAAIAGIPPLNGFMSELLIYFGFALGSHATRGTETAFVFWGAFFMLGAIAGMAVFAFTRMFGLSFLGAPRSEAALEAREPDRVMQGSLLWLASFCILFSLCAPLLYRVFIPLLSSFAYRLSPSFTLTDTALNFGEAVLLWYALASLLLAFLFGLALLLRRRAVALNGSTEGLTWDCGYRFPSARMQYSGGSFAHSTAVMLRPLIRSRIETPKMHTLFPSETQARLSTSDWPTTLWEKLIFHPIELLSDHAKGLQAGLVNIYIL
jgi:NADH:ubiquinone oxidoreductase subunit 5 (subunit L)/multisubunit Na+/H+ antiporter MnhA subunit